MAAVGMLAAGGAAAQDKPSLVERLGFAKDARVLIINGDDFGMNHATNVGTLKALKAGGITSATIMAPCPWYLEAAKMARAHPQA
ncbi:MAG TPA: ChbG/HpnK family deacetylase, partial [Candidatus Hydrogenedentes bacterium]|nr:ChbG/HpnK family deacetylase [Candidatus Hydrogenedentota bacterium]